MPSEKQIMRLKNVLAQRLKITKKCLFRLDFAATIVPNLFHFGNYHKMVDFPTSRRSIRSARIKLHGSAN